MGGDKTGPYNPEETVDHNLSIQPGPFGPPMGQLAAYKHGNDYQYTKGLNPQ